MDAKTTRMLDEKLAVQHDLHTDACDRYDYLIAAGCGAIAGLVDVFLVGSPANSKIGQWSDKEVDKTVRAFAKKCGWSPRSGNELNTSSAIGFLERKFRVNYDQRYSADVEALFQMGTTNHHLKSLSHSPDFLGLFCSILNQFTSTSTFLSDGQLITIHTERFELQGNDLISKLFCGVANWFGHIMSDIAGSSGSGGRGGGIAVPFFELFQLCDFGSFQVGEYRNTLAKVATKTFQEGYDARFGIAMSIPVLLCDLSIRLIWSIKRIFYHHEALNNCIPSNKHSSLRVMLIIGNGVLCLLDGTHAVIAAKGNAVDFFLHLNIVAWFKLIMMVLKEILIRYDFSYEDLNLQLVRTNEAFDLYLDRLKSVDYRAYTEELEEIKAINNLLRSDSNDLNTIYRYLEERTIVQFHIFDEFDKKMLDGNFVLEI